jgi:hypothetical protein
LLLRILRLRGLIVDRRLIGRRLLLLAIAGLHWRLPIRGRLLGILRRLRLPRLLRLLGILRRLRLPRLLRKRLRIIGITWV